MIRLGHGWPEWARSVPDAVAQLVVGVGAVWAASLLVPAFRIDGPPAQRAAGVLLTIAVLTVLGFGLPLALQWLLEAGTASLLSRADPDWDGDVGPLGCLVGALSFVVAVAIYPWLPYALTLVGPIADAVGLPVDIDGY